MKAVEINTTLKALQSGMGSNHREDQEAISLGLQVNSKGSHWNVAISGGRTRMRCGRQMAR
jgi:hypothetical protein